MGKDGFFNRKERKEAQRGKAEVGTAELASQARHEMDAPRWETASRNVVAEYAEGKICFLIMRGRG